MKKILSLFMVIVLCLSLFGTMTIANAEEAKEFTDITEHWAKIDIDYMAAKGMVKGVSDTEFAPERPVTRAEFLALVLRSVGKDEAVYTSAGFDITEVIDPILWDDANLDIDANITREEMTSVVVRAYKSYISEEVPAGDVSTFTDASEISDWAKSYVASAYELGIINGIDADTFAPGKTATRAQAVTIARRLYRKTGKSLKVLSLGNSFSLDSMEYLYGMLDEYGYTDVTLGILYIGGCSLEKHYNNLTGNVAEYKYYKSTSGKWVITKESIGIDGIKDEEWDIFVLQQASGSSGLADTYEPYITDIIKYVKENCPNKDVEFAWNITWAHQHDSKQSSFANNYGGDQMVMFNGIIDAFNKNVAPHEEFKYIFPVGITVQNARTSYFGDTITRDGYHMNYNIGRYMAALTWFGVLTDTPVDDFTYLPKGRPITESEREVAKESVINALANPLTITQSLLTEAPNKN